MSSVLFHLRLRKYPLVIFPKTYRYGSHNNIIACLTINSLKNAESDLAVLRKDNAALEKKHREADQNVRDLQQRFVLEDIQ